MCEYRTSKFTGSPCRFSQGDPMKYYHAVRKLHDLLIGSGMALVFFDP